MACSQNTLAGAQLPPWGQWDDQGTRALSLLPVPGALMSTTLFLNTFSGRLGSHAEPCSPIGGDHQRVYLARQKPSHTTPQNLHMYLKNRNIFVHCNILVNLKINNFNIME